MKLTSEIEINNYTKPYFIAELGSNHNGDMKLAKKLISQAKQREGGDRNALLGLYGHDPSTEGQGSDVSVTCSSPVPMVPCPWKRCFEAEGSETVTMMRDQLEKECRLYDNVPYVYT